MVLPSESIVCHCITSVHFCKGVPLPKSWLCYCIILKKPVVTMEYIYKKKHCITMSRNLVFFLKWFFELTQLVHVCVYNILCCSASLSLPVCKSLITCLVKVQSHANTLKSSERQRRTNHFKYNQKPANDSLIQRMLLTIKWRYAKCFLSSLT